jgi:hypothetical protein
MRQRRLKIHFGLDLFLNGAGKAIKPAEAIDLLCVTNPGLLQRAAQNRQ